jgi:hypothetical protein
MGRAITRDRQTKRFPLAVLAPLLGSMVLAVSPATGGSSYERLLVSFKPGTGAGAQASILTRAGAKDYRAIPQLGVRVIRSTQPATTLQRLRGDGRVRFAERDQLLAPQDMLPSDPSFPTTFAIGGGAWGWTNTRTTQAWDITRGDPSVVIAVLDTGLKSQGLSDFDGQTVSGWNVVTRSSDTSSNAGNHGTYVSGVIGLAASNGKGNAGYCPSCRIMPVQVGTDSGANLSDLATGLTWAADHGARIANLSWAGSGASSTLATAVSYARSKGMVVVAAAGNSNCNCPTYPSATPGVIGVAGTTSIDSKQGDSNYGTWVKVAAPEGNMTAWPSIGGKPGYAPVGGTSLAAPVVAGIAGLLFSANPSLTGADVERALEESSIPVGFAVQYGRVDALAALNYLGFADPQSASAPANTAAPQILLQTNGDYDSIELTSPPQAGQVLLRGQGSWTGSAPLSIGAVTWQRCDPFGACAVVGASTKYTVQAGDAGYSLRFGVTVRNGLGSTTAYSASSLPVGGTPTPPPPSTPPANTQPPAVSGTPQEGLTVTTGTGTWSGSPTSYAYAWMRCDSTGGNCTSIADATSAAYTAQAGDIGATLRASVTATNSAGSASTLSAATAAVAAAPTAPPPAPTQQKLTFSGSLNPKNPARSFTVPVGAGLAHAELVFAKCGSLNLNVYAGPSLRGSKNGPSAVVLDATLAAGSYTYEVSGGRCSFTLNVTSPQP